jgi:hypothetical protein
MVASAERPIRMTVVHDRSSDGFYVAMIPAHLSREEVDAALRQLGIEAEAVLELGGWKTAECGVAVARVPFPDKRNQFGCIWEA